MKDHALGSVDPTHHIQRQLLMALRQHGQQTYQQIKPDGLEGNAYNYHLKMLKQAGLVATADSYYSLTPLGSLVTDAFSHDTQRLVLRPNFYIYPLVVSEGHVLAYRPSRMPTKNYITLPSGKLHAGDSLEQGLRRELTRRNLDLSLCTWRQVSVVNMRYTKAGELVFHRPGVMFLVDYLGERIPSETQSGSAFWMDGHAIPKETILPDLEAGLRIMRGDMIPMIDVTYEI